LTLASLESNFVIYLVNNILKNWLKQTLPR